MRAMIALSMLGFSPSQSGRDGILPNGCKERLSRTVKFADSDFCRLSAFPSGGRPALTKTS